MCRTRNSRKPEGNAWGNNKAVGLIPKPPDDAVSKAWGYASEHARHMREGRESSYEEAKLTVGICAAVSTYLFKKNKA